jgi:Na+/H+ antiporter NhaA
VDPLLKAQAKISILGGSVISRLLGRTLLRVPAAYCWA